MHQFFAEHLYYMYLFLIIMGFIAGFVDAIAGGGGLISLPALTYTGMPMAMVLGTNKLQSSIGTGVATFKYYKDGLINFNTVYRGLLMGLLGALLGAITANFIPNDFMHYIVPFLMLAVFIFNLFNKSLGVKEGTKRMDETVFFSVFGFIIGFYDAFFGPGTGNFWVILIVYFLGYTFLNASGYAKVLNLKSNIFSLMVFVYFGHVNYLIGFIMAIGQFAGGYFGAKMVILKGSKLVRPIFIIVVGLNVLLMFYQLIFHHAINS
ncbi:MAG: TSUP family transporter [Burkholderiales bacterium]|nr:TSUP family transporter [Burkholderiales bacterium]